HDRDVDQRLGAKTIEQGRFALPQSRQPVLGEPVRVRRLGQDLGADTLVAEPLRHPTRDLVAPGSELMRNRDHRHGISRAPHALTTCKRYTCIEISAWQCPCTHGSTPAPPRGRECTMNTYVSRMIAAALLLGSAIVVPAWAQQNQQPSHRQPSTEVGSNG